MVVGLTGLWGTQVLHYSDSNIPLLVLCGQSFVWLGTSEGGPCIQRHLNTCIYHIQTLPLHFEPSVTCLYWYLVGLIECHLCIQGGMLQAQAHECVLYSHLTHSILKSLQGEHCSVIFNGYVFFNLSCWSIHALRNFMQGYGVMHMLLTFMLSVSHFFRWCFNLKS